MRSKRTKKKKHEMKISKKIMEMRNVTQEGGKNRDENNLQRKRKNSQNKSNKIE